MLTIRVRGDVVVTDANGQVAAGGIVVEGDEPKHKGTLLTTRRPAEALAYAVALANLFNYQIQVAPGQAGDVMLQTPEGNDWQGSARDLPEAFGLVYQDSGTVTGEGFVAYPPAQPEPEPVDVKHAPPLKLADRHASRVGQVERFSVRPEGANPGALPVEPVGVAGGEGTAAQGTGATPLSEATPDTGGVNVGLTEPAVEEAASGKTPRPVAPPTQKPRRDVA